jgi:hypothetical protein
MNGTLLIFQTHIRFLLARLQLDYLLEESDPFKIKLAITSLPLELTKAYEGVTKRMSTQQREFAFRILSWIFRTPRALEMNELRIALGIKFGQYKIDDETPSAS